MKERTRAFFKNIYKKVPPLQSTIRYFYCLFNRPKPKFSGWNMISYHQLPWVDNYNQDIFLLACEDIKRLFEFGTDCGYNAKNIDALKWRHWLISFALRYAMVFAKNEGGQYNLVECGVADGISAFFVLREIVARINKDQITGRVKMHLYDSWSKMKRDLLVSSEEAMAGQYAGLSFDRTKRNLSEFQDYLIYHQGFLPESLEGPPAPPEDLLYLHIDMNSVIPTQAALNFFFSRLVGGSVVIFDDYGWDGNKDTKEAIDQFFSDKPGILLKLPTGQAIFFKK